MYRATLVTVLCFVSLGVGATTINVPADLLTIQAGIDAAGEGDTVLVSNGTYSGSGNRDIDFGGKLIVVRSLNGPQWTKIDCEGDTTDRHIGFILVNGEGPGATVDGFTIENGYGHLAGGGIRIFRSSPTIRNCVLINNRSSMGGGISLYSSGSRIEGCVFTHNSAQSGGAIFMHNASPTIANSTFWSNSGLGQLCIENRSYPSIEYSLIVRGDIRIEPPYPEFDIGPSDIFPYCCIHFIRGADDGRRPYGSTQLFGFIDVNPLLCDTTTAMYSLEQASPCLPDNNQCGVLIGALDSTCLPTDVGEANGDDLPVRFSLSQNYPNPFNAETRINFAVQRAAAVKLEVFNILGQRIATLVNQRLPASYKAIIWDGRVLDGTLAPSGVYLYRITADGFVQSRKMILLK